MGGQGTSGIPVPEAEVDAALSGYVGLINADRFEFRAAIRAALSAAAAVRQDPDWTEYRLKMEALLDRAESRTEAWEGIARELYEALYEAKNHIPNRSWYDRGLGARVHRAVKAFEAASVPLVAETEGR